MTGSPKKPSPTPNVVPFTTISEEVNVEISKRGTRQPANFSREADFGNGGVGDSALRNRLILLYKRRGTETYLANLSQPSPISPITCMIGLILDHIASSTGCLVLSW